jgi:pimeloyl-ACP methyl ester carboxylesterase
MENPWSILLWVLAALLLLAGAWWAHVRFWVRRLGVAMPYASHEVLPTPDGASIELRRLPPRPDSEGPSDLPPVLLVHGLAANHRNNDMHPDSSLARELTQAGREVWLLTLRSGRHLRGRDRRRIRFAAMVHYDVPLAVDSVLERTGAGALDYVGFSMGGMLLYGALGWTVPTSKVRRAVVIGAPGHVEAPIRALRTLRWLPLALVPGLPLRLLSRTFAFVAGTRVSAPFGSVVSNPDNIAPVLARTALVDVIEDVPATLQADLVRWAATDGSITVDGERVLDRLADVEVPALFFAGTADRIVPAERVVRAYEAWGANRSAVRKELRMLGKEHGAHADYGHGDMVVGPHAHEDVFEPVVRFLGAA